MDKSTFIKICNSKLKLVRTECSYSQDKMSVILGMSKKTLVEIEKERSSLGWTGSIALCYLFEDSDIIESAFGGSPKDLINSLAFEGDEPYYPKTLSGRTWWNNIMNNEDFIIQQNIVSQHYRIINILGDKIESSFNLEDLLPVFSNQKMKKE